MDDPTTTTCYNLPTLTAVRLSSSDARLPPPALLVMLSRLLLRGVGRTIALNGLGGNDPGDAGGEDAMTARGQKRKTSTLMSGMCLCRPG